MNPLTPYKIYIQLAGAALLAIGIAAGSWWVTATYFRLQISETEKQHALKVIIAQKDAADAQERADKITYGVDAAAAEARAQRLEVTLANLRRIQKYVTPETDRLFPLPCGFVRLHDAGARGIDAATVALPAGKADGDQCDVTTSSAASIIQRNYALALDWKAEVAGWWTWFDQQKTSYETWRSTFKKEN